MKFSEYTAKNTDEALEALNTSRNGLSKKEAKNRLKIYGFNEIKTEEVGLIDIFLRQFKSPFFYLLFIASAISFLISEIVDGFVILSFVFVNIVLGFFQEARAQRTVSLLKKYIPLKVKVLREGEEKIINKKFLVPGDIIFLEMGDIAPADLRIIKTDNFLVDESVLSGESIPIAKTKDSLPEKTEVIFEAKNIVFAGTSIVAGEGLGIVISTGKETAIGGIAKLVSGIERGSVYEKDILKFSKIILRTVVVTITFIFLANLLIKGASSFFEILIFSVALIVSIIPEALPVVITFAFSEGSLKLAKEKVVVKRLSAVEDLGNIEILCTDKTGTLTKNKLELKENFSKDKEKNLLYALLCSPFGDEGVAASLNPFDTALYEKASDEMRKSIKKFKKISETPFDPDRLRSSALLTDEKGKMILIAKGAPEIILGLCSKFENGARPAELIDEFREIGKKGERILAVAFKEHKNNEFSEKDEKGMVFLGYFSFSDPLKETAKGALDLAKRLGVAIKMITGDSKEVAGHVAKEFGLVLDPNEVILGQELNFLSEADFEKTCDKFSVFARVSPETKLEIIKTLQKKFTVGFLGEGINDTPSLKAANVGIAVQEAADVPREAADIILLDKDLKVIVDGIKNGRNIFSNINKYIKCALASNFGNFYSIAFISLFITFLPMLPVQILLGNLLSDFPLIAIATDSVDAEELRKPKAYQLSHFIRLIILLALVSTLFDFIFFGIFYGILYRNQPAILQTLWFVESILTEIVLIFIIRTRHSFLKTKRPSWPLIALTFLDALFIIWLPFSKFGQEFFHFTLPPITGVLIVFCLLLGYFITSEIVKLTYFKHWKVV